jgi:hypothetical protein
MPEAVSPGITHRTQGQAQISSTSHPMVIVRRPDPSAHGIRALTDEARGPA